MKNHNTYTCKKCKWIQSKVIGGKKIDFIKGRFSDKRLFKCLLDNTMHNFGTDARGLDKSTMRREFTELKSGWCDGWHKGIILAFDGESPIGYVFDAEEGINRYVKSEYRGLGICKEMLDTMFPGVRAKKLKQMTLYYHDAQENELVDQEEFEKREKTRVLDVG